MPTVPKWKDLLAAFEEVKDLGPNEVGEKFGGKVRENKFPNACAIRLSYAFNVTGCDVSFDNGETVSGYINGEKYWFYFRKDAMEKLFIKTKLGLVPQEGTSSDAFKGKKGIIVFDIKFLDSKGNVIATGHLDLYDGEKVVSKGGDYSGNPRLEGVKLYEWTM